MAEYGTERTRPPTNRTHPGVPDSDVPGGHPGPIDPVRVALAVATAAVLATALAFAVRLTMLPRSSYALVVRLAAWTLLASMVLETVESSEMLAPGLPLSRATSTVLAFNMIVFTLAGIEFLKVLGPFVIALKSGVLLTLQQYIVAVSMPLLLGAMIPGGHNDSVPAVCVATAAAVIAGVMDLAQQTFLLNFVLRRLRHESAGFRLAFTGLTAASATLLLAGMAFVCMIMTWWPGLAAAPYLCVALCECCSFQAMLLVRRSLLALRSLSPAEKRRRLERLRRGSGRRVAAGPATAESTVDARGHLGDGGDGDCSDVPSPQMPRLPEWREPLYLQRLAEAEHTAAVLRWAELPPNERGQAPEIDSLHLLHPTLTSHPRPRDPVDQVAAAQALAQAQARRSALIAAVAGGYLPGSGLRGAFLGVGSVGGIEAALPSPPPSASPPRSPEMQQREAGTHPDALRHDSDTQALIAMPGRVIPRREPSVRNARWSYNSTSGNAWPVTPPIRFASLSCGTSSRWSAGDLHGQEADSRGQAGFGVLGGFD
ncbi:hypothetical protein HK105_203494 [Polyrhizophydium stewartii]|uniref:Transmembrane protein n=1 Tax=Polyrhizophydium stewartii TaxID=2732419 RepID=A0ABR4NC15_9FUNG